MKKAISVGIIGVIVSAMLLAAIPTASAKLYGDANEDDTINMLDVTYTGLIILGKKPDTVLADANQDGWTNVGDITYIALIILGRKPFPGGRLVVGTMWDPSTSSGAHYCGGVSPYGTNIYEPLVFEDNDMNIQPGLAKSWKRVNDYTWRFYLREGVKFHDGTTFDADAVKHIFDTWFDDPLFARLMPGRLYILSKDQIEVVDDYTIGMTTFKPLGCLPGRLANPGIVMVSPNIDALGEPCGTGPFKFVQMIPMQTLEVVRNEEYWGDGPKLEKLTIKTIFDPSTKVMALEAGDVDLIYGVPLSEVSSLESDPDIQVFEKMMPKTAILKVNANNAPLSDVRVRKAINYAINKEDIVDYIYEGIGEPARQR
jgi:peptide/nickel transport system substrate-binding protein